jgi:glutathione S-transferase
VRAGITAGERDEGARHQSGKLSGDSSKLKLYDYLDSGNAYKVRLVLAHLNVPFERIELDIDAGETRTREFLGKNPNGKIPALELASGDVLCESNAILFFLAAGTALLPQGNLERARVLQWMFFEQYSHEPYIAVSRYALKHLEPGEERRALVESKREPGYKALGVMESHLAGRSFFVDQVFTIADIALYAYTHVAHEGEFDLADFPAIRAWLARISSQPGHIPITHA